MKAAATNKAIPIILLIDGQCLLCNNITQFVVKRDKRKQFRFASLQSPAGQKLLREGNLPAEDLNTFVMVDAGRYFIKSDAALLVLQRLDGWWRFLYPLMAVPLVLRNRIYDFVARNRYRFFGRTDVCMMLTPELLGRFVENGIYSADKEISK